MLPYVPQPVLRVGGLELAAFELLSTGAVVLGHQLAIRRAARQGFAGDPAWRIVTWTVVAGLIGSHLAALLFYEPHRVLEEPLLLLQLGGGMSSFGGMIGGAAGAWWAMAREGLAPARRLAFLDAVAFAFPFAWVLGRTGCALAHDHLGVASNHWLAVAFPDGGRLDLGLLELLWTLLLAALWLALDRRPRRSGTYTAAWLLLYGPVRFGLDALRTEDARLLGLTFGQAASAVAVAAGVALGVKVWHRPAGGGAVHER